MANVVSGRIKMVIGEIVDFLKGIAKIFALANGIIKELVLILVILIAVNIVLICIIIYLVVHIIL